MTKPPRISDEELRQILADRRNDPEVPSAKDWAASDFWNNPDNADRIRIRKRERRINQARKERDMDLS